MMNQQLNSDIDIHSTTADDNPFLSRYYQFWYHLWSFFYCSLLVIAWSWLTLEKWGQDAIAANLQKTGLGLTCIMITFFSILLCNKLIEKMSIDDNDGNRTDINRNHQLSKQINVQARFIETALLLMLGFQLKGMLLVIPVVVQAIMMNHSSLRDRDNNQGCVQWPYKICSFIQFTASFFLCINVLLSYFNPSLPDLTTKLPMKIIYCTILASAFILLIKSMVDIKESNTINELCFGLQC